MIHAMLENGVTTKRARTSERCDGNENGNQRCVSTVIGEVPITNTLKRASLPYRYEENKAAEAAAAMTELKNQKEIEKERSLNAILVTTVSSSKPNKPSRLLREMSAVIDDDAAEAATAMVEKEREIEKERSLNAILGTTLPSSKLNKLSRLSKKMSAVIDDSGDDDLFSEWPPESNVDELDDENEYEKLALIAKNKVNIPAVQAPFQPSSTTYDEKKRRFLVWNSVGNITCSHHGMNNRIEIQFTNSNTNKSVVFSDSFGFSMASLSHQGAIFASNPEEDSEGLDPLNESKGSTVFYHAFPGQLRMKGANETYTVTLDTGEAALAVAVGEGWSAVATSQEELRLFSSTGIPIALISLRGPVVTMVGYIHQLAVYYHDRGQIVVEIMEISARDNVKKSILVTPVPLSPNSQLSWVGFDITTGSQVTVDSRGKTRILLCSLGWQWTRVLDLNAARRTPDHTLWPVTVKGSSLSHVLLNGESRPATYPRPVTSLEMFKMPITKSREGKDKGVAQNIHTHSLLWENCLTCHFEALKGVENSSGSLPEGMTSEELEIKLGIHQNKSDTALMHLMQFACQQRRLPLSTDYAHRLRTEQGLAVAMKIANHFGNTSLAAAIDDMLVAKQQAADELAWQQQQAQGQYQKQYRGEGMKGGEEGRQIEGGDDHMDSHEDRENSALAESNKHSGSNNSNSNKDSSTSLSRKKKSDFNKDIVQDTCMSVKPDDMPIPRHQPINPFARQGAPPTRKSLIESLKDLTRSPSPKKAKLSRLSPFVQNARSSLIKGKNFL